MHWGWVCVPAHPSRIPSGGVYACGMLPSTPCSWAPMSLSCTASKHCPQALPRLGTLYFMPCVQPPPCPLHHPGWNVKLVSHPLPQESPSYPVIIPITTIFKAPGAAPSSPTQALTVNRSHWALAPPQLSWCTPSLLYTFSSHVSYELALLSWLTTADLSNTRRHQGQTGYSALSPLSPWTSGS